MKHNPRRANGHRRNKLRARILAEESVCHICQRPVDVSLPHGRPDSPEVDELVPVAHGGNPYDRNNCRLSHRLCNQQRWHRERAQRPRIAAYRTTRTW